MKILLKIAYCGTAYCGWQVQKNAPSVQETLCLAAKEIYGEDIKVTGCSRTDSGVHAKEYFCTLEVPSIAPVIPEISIPKAFTAHLPYDISVISARYVSDSFHARYSVKEKTYEYLFDNGEHRDPFLHGRAWHVLTPLDDKIMDEASKQFVGTYDFSAFMASGSSVSDTVRTVTDASVIRNGTQVIFKVSANGFLYNMVRIMAGTLHDVSVGKISPDEIKNIILSGERKNAGITAVPDGLYLSRVIYPDDAFN